MNTDNNRSQAPIAEPRTNRSESTALEEPPELRAANQAIRKAWWNFGVMTGGTAVMAAAILGYTYFAGAASAPDWWARATGIHGSWEPSGLLAILLGTGVTLFLGIQVGQALSTSVSGPRAVVLHEMVWPVLFVSAILAWMTIPLAWAADGSPMLNVAEAVLAALFLCMLAGFSSPSADRRAYEAASLRHQRERAVEEAALLDGRIGLLSQRPQWRLWSRHLAAPLGIAVLTGIAVAATSHHQFSWTAATLVSLLGWPALSVYATADALPDALVGHPRGGMAMVGFGALILSLVGLAVLVTAWPDKLLFAALAAGPVLQVVTIWRARRSLTALALAHRVLGRRCGALERDLKKLPPGDASGQPLQPESIDAPVAGSAPAARAPEARRRSSWRIALGLAAGATLGGLAATFAHRAGKRRSL
jgi:hypothetical protein